MALLEKIKSPLLGGGEQTAADVIPGLYLLSLPSAQGAKHLKTLTEDAFAWADTLAPADFSRRWVAALKAIRAACACAYERFAAEELAERVLTDAP